MPWEPLDIEELHKIAQKHKFCPYFGTKDRAKEADIIFMPYNYLIDEKIRNSYKLNLHNCIVIFDEAHNITQAQEDVTSFEFRSKLLEGCIVEFKSLKENMAYSKNDWKLTEENLNKIEKITANFLKYFNNMSLNKEDHPHALAIKESKFLPEGALVLSGN